MEPLTALLVLEAVKKFFHKNFEGHIWHFKREVRLAQKRASSLFLKRFFLRMIEFI
jgi:hypothetical protein